MATKHLSIGLFSFIGSNILSAQSIAVSHSEQLEGVNTLNMVRQLEQIALLTLVGVVVLLGVGWICSIGKACLNLNQPAKKINRSSASLLIWVIGLSIFCGSCGTMAAQYRATAATERRTCPCPQESINRASMAFDNGYPSTAYSNLYTPSFCKFCGQRIGNKR